MSNFKVLETLNPSMKRPHYADNPRQSKESYFDDEEILEVDETFKVLPPAEQGSLYFAYSMTSDNAMGVKDRYGNDFRLPHINHRGFLTKICSGIKDPILVMSEGAYESFTNDNFYDIPGTTLVVITKSQEYDDHEIVTVPDLEALEKQIKAACSIGRNIILNGGPKTLNHFLNIAKGEFVLYHQKSSQDYKSRNGDKVVFFTNERAAGDNSKVLFYRDAIPGITRIPATLVYREFVDFTKDNKTLAS